MSIQNQLTVERGYLAHRRLLLFAASSVSTIFFLWFLMLVTNPLHAQAEKANYATDRVLLAFHKDSSSTRASNHNIVVDVAPLSAIGQAQRHSQAEIYIAHLAKGVSVEQAIEELSADVNIAWVEPDYIAYPASQPDDPLLSQQWGLYKIGITQTWNVVTGSANVVIAVLDSGIEFNHPDLASKLWINPGEIGSNGIDDDNNGYIDDVKGWDFVSEDNDPVDFNGHGTQVAGGIAAATNNGIGIAGVCQACRIMPVQVMQLSGFANYSDITQGVLYAAQKGADVINISLGGYQNSTALRQAIEIAVEQHGAVIVAGAGNDNRSQPFYPAAYDNVIAVGGTTITDTKTAFSNYGTWIDVVAPASNITTTFLGSDYGIVNGTSYAAPFVAGLAGLIRSQHPEWSPELIANQIARLAVSVDGLNPSFAGQLGSGRIDAYASVATTPYPVLMIEETFVDGDAIGRLEAGQIHAIDVALYNDWLSTAGVSATLTTNDPLVTINIGSTTFGPIQAGVSEQSNSPFNLTVDNAAEFNHAINFTLHLTSSELYSATLPLTLLTRSANEPVAGSIVTNTVWTSDKTYILEANVGVAPGYTLTIEPGTTVRMGDSYKLDIGGTLFARGTPENPIRFVLTSGASQLYFASFGTDGIYDSEYNYLSGSIVEYAQFEGSGLRISCQGGRPYLAHITIAGSIDCQQGARGSLEEPIVIRDSQVAESVTVPGHVILLNSQIEKSLSGGDQGASLIVDSDIGFNASLGADSTVRNSSFSSLSVGNGSVVEWAQVNGDLNVNGEGSVYSSTVTAGGIVVGDGSIVQGNTIQDTMVDFAALPGLYSDGSITAVNNRLVNTEMGINVNGGLVQGNLVADAGISIGGDAQVISNTIIESPTNGLHLRGGTQFEIRGNNFIRNGNYAIRTNISNSQLPIIIAQGNWWETTSSSAINGKIYDFNDDYTLSRIVYAPVLTAPAQTAPAYVVDTTILPGDVIGIEEMTVEVEYSRPMDEDIHPTVQFVRTDAGAWELHRQSYEYAVAIDGDGDVLLGTESSFAVYDGETWENLPWASDGVREIEVVGTNHWWLVSNGNAVYEYLNGTVTSWDSTFYGSEGNFGEIRKVDVTPSGKIWGITDRSVVSYDGSEWTQYTPLNSGLPDASLRDIAVGLDQVVWIATSDALVMFDGTTWETLELSELDSGTHGDISAAVVDNNGTLWVANESHSRLLSFDGTQWQIHQVIYNPLFNHNVAVNGIDVRSDNALLLSTGNGLVILKDDQFSHYQVPPNSNQQASSIQLFDAVQSVSGYVWVAARSDGLYGMVLPEWTEMTEATAWTSPYSYRASFNMTTLHRRAAYSVMVSSASPLNSVETIPSELLTFTVAYAAAIANETTPPLMPSVVLGYSAETNTIDASWHATDPDTPIDKYRYALGESPSATEVLNWTITEQDGVVRGGLQLTNGVRYYLSVQARNAGGLYSPVAIASFVAGETQVPTAVGLSSAITTQLTSILLTTVLVAALLATIFMLQRRLHRKPDRYSAKHIK